MRSVYALLIKIDFPGRPTSNNLQVVSLSSSPAAGYNLTERGCPMGPGIIFERGDLGFGEETVKRGVVG